MYQELKFLVVDDHAAARHMVALLLRSLGARYVETVGNGAEALKYLKLHQADIVLSDWNMPVMNGLALLREIRADAVLATTPFVMIMMESSRDKVQEVIDAGVTNLIVKPLTAARLDAKVSGALKGRLAETRTTQAAPASAPTGAAPATLENRESSRSTILAVDDTPDNLKLISGIFEDDYKIKVAHNGEKALSICFSETPPDLVLLDVMMPGMDGFEVARRMREHPNSEHIPIIFVTAVADERARANGLALGAVDYVTKPIEPDGLRMRVRNFMRYVERHKQLQGEYDAMLDASRLREDVEQITHSDTRGPLAAAATLVRQMLSEPNLDEAQAIQLDLVEEGILQALDRINASTELYKITAERYAPRAESVDLAEILGRAIARARIAYAAKRLTLALEVEGAGGARPLALGDPMLSVSMVRELLNMACVTAPELTQVELVLHDEVPLRCTIALTGSLSDNERAALFDKPSADLGDAEEHGGFNVYLAKMYCEAQGGSLAVETAVAENRISVVMTLPRPGY